MVGMKDTKLSEKMVALFERWKASGQSLRAFGQQEGVGYAKLVYWRRKLSGAGSRKAEAREAKPAGAIELAPVEVVREPTRVAAPAVDVLSVWLANGVSLEVPVGIDEEALGRLVRTLSTC